MAFHYSLTERVQYAAATHPTISHPRAAAKSNKHQNQQRKELLQFILYSQIYFDFSS